jgi:hypothetical protein
MQGIHGLKAFAMQRSILLLVFILLIAITGMEALRSTLDWYSPFLVALGVILLAALLQLPPRHDDI